MNQLNEMKRPFAIFLIWLFHVSAIIGVTIGHKDWFLSKTPMNLSLSLFLFFWVFSMDSIKKVLLFALFFAMGMFAEWLGVNYQLLFGTYAYGTNFGPQLDGVPWLIGCFWALLAFVSYIIAQKLPFHKYVKLFVGACEGRLILLTVRRERVTILFFVECNIIHTFPLPLVRSQTIFK